MVGETDKVLEIDDLNLEILVEPIGKEGSDAQTKNIKLRYPESKGLPYSATITVNKDRLEDMSLSTVLEHEIGHALGFNPEVITKEKDLLFENGSVKSFKGKAALEKFKDMEEYETFKTKPESDDFKDKSGKIIAIPLNYGASDKNWAHWNEDLFDKELLMTPAFDKGEVAKDITLAALQDMGYDLVNDF